MFFAVPGSSCQTIEPKSNPDWTLSGNMLLNKSIVKDEKFSALSFAGTSLGAAMSVNCRLKHADHTLTVFFTKGDLQTMVPPAAKLSQSIFNVDYCNSYLIYQSHNYLLAFRAGGSILFFSNKRDFTNFINLRYSSETAASLGALFEIGYRFSENIQSISIKNRTLIPFITYYGQQAYGSNFGQAPESAVSNSSGRIFENGKFARLSNFFRLKNYLAIEKKIGSRHCVSIAYTWDFYQIKSLLKVTEVNHQLGLIYSYRL